MKNLFGILLAVTCFTASTTAFAYRSCYGDQCTIWSLTGAGLMVGGVATAIAGTAHGSPLEGTAGSLVAGAGAVTTSNAMDMKMKMQLQRQLQEDAAAYYANGGEEPSELLEATFASIREQLMQSGETAAVAVFDTTEGKLDVAEQIAAQ
jgi:hypothetical protein